MYPMGVRLKFWKSYEKWKLDCNEYTLDLRMECSTNSLASTSSFTKVKNFSFEFKAMIIFGTNHFSVTSTQIRSKCLWIQMKEGNFF